MNFAFSAVIIFLLLSPGVAFRTLFLKSDSLRSNIDVTILSELFFVIFPSILIHSLGISILWHYFKQPLYLEQIYYLIIGAKASEGLKFDLIDKSINYFILYIVCTCLLSGVLGYLAQILVISTNLDLKYSFLTVSNEWDTLFSGRALEKEIKENLEYVQVDVLVETSDGDIVYCGVLRKYTLTKQGLDKIYLYPVYRRLFSADNKNLPNNEKEPYWVTGSTTYRSQVLEGKFQDNRYYNMPGNFFIIAYSQIKNINISYIISEVQNKDNDGKDKVIKPEIEGSA